MPLPHHLKGAPVTDFARPFVLDRLVDHSGVSGPGIVADGVQFPDGRVALRWRGPGASTNAHDSIDTVLRVHGHNGDTRIVWGDGEEQPNHGFAGLPGRTPGAAQAAIKAQWPDEDTADTGRTAPDSTGHDDRTTPDNPVASEDTPDNTTTCNCTGSNAGLNACTVCPVPWPDIPGATRIRRSAAAPATPSDQEN